MFYYILIVLKMQTNEPIERLKNDVFEMTRKLESHVMEESQRQMESKLLGVNN